MSVLSKSLPKARKSLESRDKLYSMTEKKEEPFSQLREIPASFPCVRFRLKITPDPSGKTTVLSKRIRELPHGQGVGWRECNSWGRRIWLGFTLEL